MLLARNRLQTVHLHSINYIIMAPCSKIFCNPPTMPIHSQNGYLQHICSHLPFSTFLEDSERSAHDSIHLLKSRNGQLLGFWLYQCNHGIANIEFPICHFKSLFPPHHSLSMPYNTFLITLYSLMRDVQHSFRSFTARTLSRPHRRCAAFWLPVTPNFHLSERSVIAFDSYLAASVQTFASLWNLPDKSPDDPLLPLIPA